MTHAASCRACHPLRPVHHDLEAGRDLRPGRPSAHRSPPGCRSSGPAGHDHARRPACRPASGQETLGAIDTVVRPNAFAARSTRSRPARPSQGSTAAPTAACSSAPRGPSGSARTPRSSLPSRAPVRSSRPARDRHWPPPSTRADRRPVYPRTLRQHREARIMSGHSRSATAHPGYSPHRIARLGQAATTTGHHRRVISSILRSRRGPSIAELGHEDIHLRTGPCHRLSGRLIRDEPRRCHHPVAELRTG